MFGMVIERIIITDVAKVTGEMDKKIVAIGVSKLLCQCSNILNEPYINYWMPILQALIQIFELPPDLSTIDGDHFIEIDDAPGYQVAYSKLNYAEGKNPDPFPDIIDGRKFLVESLVKLCQQHPDIKTKIISLPDAHRQALQQYCTQYGVNVF